MARQKVILATFNRDKVRELRQLLAHLPLDVIGFYDVPGANVPPESGQTVDENALEKARAAYDLTGFTSIADDTALEVDALGGQPGIFAARFAGLGASYTDNLRRLLEMLADRDPENRTARFRTACVACMTSGREVHAEGVLEGRITGSPRGENGFGYDPIFEVGGAGRTLAEMSPDEKNAVSHRALAMRTLIRKMELS
ncbi:MAG: RdgB/HAM1 family non-canonical purine NTP pyrophosphatase [Candidatus Eisenbacteria bacterium]